ncbi:hypothetical protein ACIQ6R_35275 [Streptomyces sp. NPDC096048]
MFSQGAMGPAAHCECVTYLVAALRELAGGCPDQQVTYEPVG